MFGVADNLVVPFVILIIIFYRRPETLPLVFCTRILDGTNTRIAPVLRLRAAPPLELVIISFHIARSKFSLAIVVGREGRGINREVGAQAFDPGHCLVTSILITPLLPPLLAC